jgi:hypothetical protein
LKLYTQFGKIIENSYEKVFSMSKGVKTMEQLCISLVALTVAGLLGG